MKDKDIRLVNIMLIEYMNKQEKLYSNLSIDNAEHIRGLYERINIIDSNLDKVIKDNCKHDNIKLSIGYTENEVVINPYYAKHICIDCGEVITIFKTKKEYLESKKENLLKKIEDIEEEIKQL